ncbi:MAG TPA: XdhC family protein [Candidatus Saccharimonadia bacterium]|nr:XdhC family protein [Candidatus Saccharimonadia bacterium]
MDERLFTRLDALVQSGPVVLASVVATRGATPRKAGSRMLVTSDDAEFSVGGGLAEARVIDAARAMLLRAEREADVAIDLSGGAGTDGVCGGRMQVALRLWDGSVDRFRARTLATELQSGRRTTISAAEAGADATLQPDVRLVIVGAGHCALALYELARHLDFDLWVYDREPARFARAAFAAATCIAGPEAGLARALDTTRTVHAVLLNRDFTLDIAALEFLAPRRPAFVTMMGSRRRIEAVVAALPQHRDFLDRVEAPVGIELGAETPHEIAVSILARLVQVRRAATG